MILQVNADWRIQSDSQQWIVQKRYVRQKGKNIGDVEWENQAYHTRPDKAALWLAHRGVRDMPGTYPAADALEAMSGPLGRLVDEIIAVLPSLCEGAER